MKDEILITGLLDIHKGVSAGSEAASFQAFIICLRDSAAGKPVL
jgi:hypothetical protein